MNSKSTINILHLRCTFKRGGVEKVIQTLINADFGENIEVNHILAVLKNDYDEKFVSELKSLGYKIYFLEDNILNIPSMLFKLKNIINNEKINLVHANDIGSMKIASLCKLITPNLKVVYTAHSCNIISNANLLEKFLLKNIIDMNIAVSDSVHDEFVNLSINNSAKIYNGIDINKFKHNKLNDDLQNISTFKLVNVGWLRLPIKGQDILLKALGECKKRGIKFTCDFIGNFADEESEKYIKNLIEESNISNVIYFLGSRNDINSILCDYDLLAFPSRTEAFGLVIIEAMASKVPVVASNIDGPAELIKHGENGLLFENENYLDLADNIQYLYNNRRIMDELADNAYKFVQDFDISIMANKYLQLYCNLLGIKKNEEKN